MSMLAERKIKQKWSLNPTGKDWSEDSSKFGQKMLEKMGWSKGKGLGPRENGISEHIKISYKNDSKGMGYKDRNDQWTEHDTNFTALLESLSGEKPPINNITVSSLEAKSQNSRVRVHYKKFTRGKDVSRWSEKDLANIFGKRSLNDSPKVSDSENSNETIQKPTDKGFIQNRGSMVDYFKKKLPNFGKSNGYVVGSNGVLAKEESDEEERVGFGFDKKRKGNEVLNGTPKKIRLEEREEQGLMNPAFDPMYSNIEVQKHVLNTIVEEGEETEVHIKKNKKKSDKVTCEEKVINTSSTDYHKKKKKKAGITNGIIEVSVEVGDVSNNDSKESQKKKKKQLAAADNPIFEENDDNNCSTPTNNMFEVKRKKNKKTECSSSENLDGRQNGPVDTDMKIKKNRKSCDFSPGVDNANFDTVEGSQTNSQNNGFEVKRKKKQKKEAPGIENPNFDEIEESQNNSQNNDFEVKRKKKQKKEAPGIENPNFDELEESKNINHNNDYEVKRKNKKNEDSGIENPKFSNVEETQNISHNSDYEVKKKKKKNNSGIENPNFDVADSSQNGYQSSEYEVTRKKKKSEECSFGIENPNFDIMDASQSSYNDSTFEVKRKKKKKKDLAIDNPSFTTSNDDSQISNSAELKEKSQEEPCLDLVLNVTSTPSLSKAAPSKQSSIKRRKSVRFSNVNEQRIIPNNEDIENRNELFDINSKVIANGLNDSSTSLDLEEISKKIDGFQAEVENDINEAKVTKFIGEVGNPDGLNEKLPQGTKLKFKYANFGKSPVFPNKNTSKAKTSYKHLIKGDIILGFKNTNLHEIVGYGVKK